MPQGHIAFVVDRNTADSVLTLDILCRLHLTSLRPLHDLDLLLHVAFFPPAVDDGPTVHADANSIPRYLILVGWLDHLSCAAFDHFYLISCW